MLKRNIQSFEIVPQVLDLGAFRHRKPQTPHNVGQIDNRLGDRVKPSQPRPGTRNGNVKRGAAGGALGFFPPDLPSPPQRRR